jgi:hypothetical protein
MRRALALALTTGLALPASAIAAQPYTLDDLVQRTPLVDKSLIAHQRATKLRAARARRNERRRERRAAAAANQPAPIPGHLAAIAACESGGNPQAIGGGGAYRGAFQMTYAAWASVGGQGDPAAAPMSEQVRRAAMLYAQSGPGQWPVCGA